MNPFDFTKLASTVIDGLARDGYCIVPEAFPKSFATAVRAEIEARIQAGDFHAAAIGRGAARQMQPEIRSDGISWIDGDRLTAVCDLQLWDFLSLLRIEMNRELQLGLWDFEGHYAVYPPGAFYRKHLDRFQDDSKRTVSVVMYFNSDWKEEDGGLLVLHASEGSKSVRPESGTAVFFLSDRMPHEVTEARRTRMSFAAWLRTR